ncbi:MAG: ABC transporter permease [Thermomicrobiales bacterium]
MSMRPSRSSFGHFLRGTALGAILSSLAAVVVALLIGFLIILISGDDPVEAYRALFHGAVGDKRGIGETLVLSTPLLLAGLAFAIPFRAGMFNIGAEGQLVIGGLAAGLVGAVDLGLPIYLHLPLALLAAAVAGGLWGAIPGALKAWSGAHEVITTIMLNYIAFRVVAYTLNEADSWLPVNPMLQASDPVEKSAKLPIILHGTRLHAGFLLALAAAAVLWYLLFRTIFGYRIRTVGSSRGAADYAGFSWKRTIIVAMFTGGLMAGLGGAAENLGLQGRVYNISPGYGFTAIAVGLVGRNHPLGIVLAALLFGALRSGATEMQNTAGTSKELVQILQGLVILSVSGFSSIGYLMRRRTTRRRAEPAVTTTVGVEPGYENPAI